MRLNTEKFDYLREILRQRILILDGAMGSMIQCNCHKHQTAEEKLPDLLVSDLPDIIRDIHKKYLEAGADIIETDSFNSNKFSLSDYALAEESYRLSRQSAVLAREAADLCTSKTPEKPRFVAGSVGPTKHMLSLSDGESSLTFDSMSEAFGVQIRGLLDGGADIILLETVFDTLNVKSALYAISVIEEERGEKIPVMVSATVDPNTGRLLSGQTLEAFYASVSHAGLLSIGINCGFGSGQVLPLLRSLSEVADVAISVYPNAGLPNERGEYDERPDEFSRNLKECLEESLVNIIGGCCGTTPEHIEAVSHLAAHYEPRQIPEKSHTLILSSMEYNPVGKSRELIQVGERSNVAGSAKFARLVKEKNFEEALEIVAKQIMAGASVVDLCMDDGMADVKSNMLTLIRMITSNPETAVVPVMIDSSDWDVIKSALRVSAGKNIVNSISLKDGESVFLSRAREIRRLGAAVVVMLFDENGQASTFERKIEVAKRSYELLTQDGFLPEDIIFDPNVLTVGASLESEDRLALDFIKATEWIKENLPNVSVSGGISNLSFAFRGNNPLREAMHTVFMYHASKAGMDMAIVNAGMLGLYSDIPQQLLSLVEDLILCRQPNAVEPLLAYTSNADSKKQEKGDNSESDPSEQAGIEERICKALDKGKDKEMELLLTEAMSLYTPMDIIEKILMPEMKRIGVLFGEGRMFLPQVIKSAQTMHKAVGQLSPYMEIADKASEEKKKVILATVRGDVHDIGKNIVGLVVSCNGFEVVDLGVRVDEKTIVKEAEAQSPVAILLSGLISPSLNEMIKVCRELEKRNLDVPVIVGGAATSEMHTAVKITPEYSGPVFYSKDASANLSILQNLMQNGKNALKENSERQNYLRKLHSEAVEIPSEDRTEKRKEIRKPVVGTNAGMEQLQRSFNDLAIEEVEKFIDWDALLWSLEINNAEDKNSSEKREELLKEAKALLEEVKCKKTIRIDGVLGIFKAHSKGDDIILQLENGNVRVLPMLRGNERTGLQCVADFLAPDNDHIALFAISSGFGLKEEVEKLNHAGEFYKAYLLKLLADRLAEASARYVHSWVAREIWKLSETDTPEAHGIRIAFGYPSAPDHTLKRDVFEIMEVENQTGMRLTETSMVIPSEAVVGMILPRGEYINVGKLDAAALVDYAGRRNITVEELKNIIPYNIADPND